MKYKNPITREVVKDLLKVVAVTCFFYVASGNPRDYPQYLESINHKPESREVSEEDSNLISIMEKMLLP